MVGQYFSNLNVLMNHMTDLAKMQTLIEQVWAKEDRDGNLNKLLAGGKAAALQVTP